MEKEKIKAFLIEYEILCLKHGLSLHGCGCCGSPYIYEGKPDLWHHAKEEDLVAEEDVCKKHGVDEDYGIYDLSEEVLYSEAKLAIAGQELNIEL